MLSVYYGNNRVKSEEAYLKHGASGAEKSHIALTSDEAIGGQLKEYVLGQSLFGDSNTISIRGLLDTVEGQELVGELLAELVDCHDHVVLLEQELSKELEKKLSKKGAKLNKFERSKGDIEREVRAAKQEASKIYAVADALARRDRRGLWLEYQRALRRGVVAEELYWKLVWQMRAMLVASGSASSSEAGLHPYVYDKSKSGASNYSRDELASLSGSLLQMWHDIHAKGKDLELALEQFILSV